MPNTQKFISLRRLDDFKTLLDEDIDSKLENVGSTLSVQFTQANTFANITSGENISTSFGKLSKWYDEIAKKPGEITTGKQYTISGQTVTAGTGAEAFNDLINNKASGNYSHAEGGYTTASGYCSHAEGSGTTVSGDYSHAEGYSTTASGSDSHAEGYSTTVSGDYSHAEGYSTTASGSDSHAEGLGTTASEWGSHAEGRYTIAASQYQHVQGKFNVVDSSSTYAFIIGNGTSNSARHNAFAIDWNGLIYVNGATTGVNVTKKPGEITTGKQYTISGQTVTAGTGAEVFNDYTNNKASGQYSHAEGVSTTASGDYSHAEGYETTASIYFSHAEGFHTTASGQASHAEGGITTASGNGSHAEGVNTTASGDYSHAEGESTIAASSHQHVQGKFNVVDSSSTYAFIIGNGTYDEKEEVETRHNAFAVDWNGLIYVNGAATGVDVAALAATIGDINTVLESVL